MFEQMADLRATVRAPPRKSVRALCTAAGTRRRREQAVRRQSMKRSIYRTDTGAMSRKSFFRRVRRLIDSWGSYSWTPPPPRSKGIPWGLTPRCLPYLIKPPSVTTLTKCGPISAKATCVAKRSRGLEISFSSVLPTILGVSHRMTSVDRAADP